MALNLRNIHETRFDPGSLQTFLISEHNVMTFFHGNERIFFQDGEASFAAGVSIPENEIPAWVWETYRTNTPLARKAVGVELPEDKITSPQDLSADFLEVYKSLSSEMREKLRKEFGTLDLPKGQWECDKCGEIIPKQRKGLHIANHIRFDEENLTDGDSGFLSPELSAHN